MTIHIILGFVILFLLVKMWIFTRNKDLPKGNGEFKRGYNGAELRIQARSDISKDDFYRGWVKACEDRL